MAASRRPLLRALVAAGVVLLLVAAAAVWWLRTPRLDVADGAETVGGSTVAVEPDAEGDDGAGGASAVLTLPDFSVLALERRGPGDAMVLLDRTSGETVALPEMSRASALREDGSGIGFVASPDASFESPFPTTLVSWAPDGSELARRDVADLFPDLSVRRIRGESTGEGWVQVDLTLEESLDASVVAVLDAATLDVRWSEPLETLRDRVGDLPLPDLTDVVPELGGTLPLVTAGPGSVALSADDGTPVARSEVQVFQLGDLLVVDDAGDAVGWSATTGERRWRVVDAYTSQAYVDRRDGYLTVTPRQGEETVVVTADTVVPDEGAPTRRRVGYAATSSTDVDLGTDPVTGEVWDPDVDGDGLNTLGQFAFQLREETRLAVGDRTEVRSLTDGRRTVTAHGRWSVVDLGPGPEGAEQVWLVRYDGDEATTALVAASGERG